MSIIQRRGRLLAAIVLAAAGCSGGGDGLPREAISGAVTLDGKPLARGMIQFRPADAGSATVEGGSAIEAGQFSISRAAGLVPGNYKVAINATAEGEGPPAKGRVVQKSGLAKELIPPRFNSKTELTVEVKKGGASGLKFDLQSK